MTSSTDNESGTMLVYERLISTGPKTGAALYIPSSGSGLIRHGYLLREDLIFKDPANDHLDNVPNTFTLDDTWQQTYPGVYLFFPKLPDGDEARLGFLRAAANQLKHPDRKRVRFAWFSDPEKWPAGLSSPVEIEVRGAADTALSSQQTIFSADKYSLRMTKGNRIYPNTAHTGFVFESNAYPNTFGAYKRTQLQGGLELILDNDPHQGCFRFHMNMSGEELNALNIGLDYFWRDQNWGTQKLNYPVFDVAAQREQWLLLAVFDPLDPLNDSSSAINPVPERFDELRTGVAFVDIDDDGIIPPLPTYFRTRYGKPIVLTPVAGNLEGTVENVKPSLFTLNQTGTRKTRLSFVLQGDFHLAMGKPLSPTANHNEHFLCGLSGTETISFQAAGQDYSGDILRFHPGKPAFSPGFPMMGHTGQANQSSPALLDSRLRTSWISIRTLDPSNPARQNYYYSQPQDAPLFKALPNSGNRLAVFDAPSANLAHSDTDRDCFPLVPTAAAPLGKKSPKGKEIRLEYETQVINPCRKQTIAAETTRARPLVTQILPQQKTAPADMELTTTPQGFLVAFNPTDVQKRWQSLILANDGTSQRPPLEFTDLPPYVQSAFQTNEQFLVISNPDRETLDYLKHRFQDRIDIAQWPFILDVAGNITNSNQSSRYRNVLIFKFCRHSLVERLKHPELWVQPDTFNRKTRHRDLAEWILAYIDRSRTATQQLTTSGASSHGPSIIGQGYDDFLEKVDDPNWNGIMALQVTLDLAQLPKAIKSIVAGIDIRRFAAHHVAINSNQILSENGRIQKNFKSSMYGLIRYFDEDYGKIESTQGRENGPLPKAPGDFDFKVLELQVLFRHSEISDFNCKIQLSINSMFNEPVIRESNRDSSAINSFSIVLEGLYDKHDGHTAYTFRQVSENNLSLNSSAVRSATIHGIELSTVNETSETDPEKTTGGKAADGRVTTRFALSGQMAMQEMDDFDMLSYDAIRFSALHIDMHFDIKAPQSSKRFDFNPAEILLNPSESRVRDGSLAAHFPISLESLVYAIPDGSLKKSSPAVSPSTLGYQRVEAPMNYNAISSTWYGLQFNLNLGTMGSLAAKAGFEAALLLSWSPGIHNKAAQIWIKTPFSGGGKQFSIQGVLKLVTQSIRLEKQPDKPEYAMLFTNIKVSLLGLKLPPAGNTLLYLFGNPDQPGTVDASGTGNLGWFGAYKKTQKENKNKKSRSSTHESKGAMS